MTSEAHSARYFALLYSPTPQRLVLDALFGIEREVNDSLRRGLDHNVAHSRLQWWREECERATGGQPVHPLTRALVEALPAANPVPQLSGLSGLVDVAVWDLAGATFETRRELTAYCERWAAAMVEPLVPYTVGGASVSAPSISDWRSLGASVREIELLTELAREAHYGRLRVPLDELESANADARTLATPPWPETVAALLRARHRSLRGEIARAAGNSNSEQQAALRGVLVWAAVVWRLSRRVESALPDRLRTGRFDAIADGWFAWRIARRATLGRFRLN